MSKVYELVFGVNDPHASDIAWVAGVLIVMVLAISVGVGGHV